MPLLVVILLYNNRKSFEIFKIYVAGKKCYNYNRKVKIQNFSFPVSSFKFLVNFCARSSMVELSSYTRPVLGSNPSARKAKRIYPPII